MLEQRAFDGFIARTTLLKLTLHACHWAIESARDDQIEVVEVCAHIDRESVERHPFADAQSHRADLRRLSSLRISPHACRALVALCADAELAHRVDDAILEQAHVAVDPEFRSIEIDDRIAHKLSRSVIGDIAAAICLVDFNAVLLEQLVGRRDMCWRVRTARDSDDRIVLDEEHASELRIVRIASSEDLRVMDKLLLVRGLIAEIAEFHNAEMPLSFHAGLYAACARMAACPRSIPRRS